MQFAYEAMRTDGATVRDLIDATNSAAAVDALRERGLMVLRLAEQAQTAPAEQRPGLLQSRGVSTRDLIIFTRQMKMLLEAGSPVVPALEATEAQTAKPVFRELLRRLRQRVEEGDSLAAALEPEKKLFDPVFRTMIAAGEATATLPQVFGRLSALAQQRLQTQRMVTGALIYPCVLCLLLIGVVSLLLFFVVPRFSGLFAGLNRPMPALTQLLFFLSDWIRHGWPYVLGALVFAVAGLVIAFRTPAVRTGLDQACLQLPVVGPLLVKLTFARIVRVWAAMLRCHVPLLETIRQSRDAVRNAAFLRLIEQVEEAVSSGGRMAQAIGATKLADPIIVSAIRTGEENGRLAEAVDFVSDWLDEDNTVAVQHVTRLAEPLLLAVMGFVVGGVAMALFIPLFDMATAA
jgi:type II secretory pathway component PulF